MDRSGSRSPRLRLAEGGSSGVGRPAGLRRTAHTDR